MVGESQKSHLKGCGKKNVFFLLLQTSGVIQCRRPHLGNSRPVNRTQSRSHPAGNEDQQQAELDLKEAPHFVHSLHRHVSKLCFIFPSSFQGIQPFKYTPPSRIIDTNVNDVISRNSRGFFFFKGQRECSVCGTENAVNTAWVIFRREIIMKNLQQHQPKFS